MEIIQDKDKQPGFSLMELIIVIAIMAVLASGIALSIGLLRSSDAKKLAGEINSSFTTLRSDNMAKSELSYMHIYYYENDYYIQMSKDPTPLEDGSGRNIGSGSVTVSFKGKSDISLGSGLTSVLTFCINKKDGSFVEKVNNTELKTTSEIEISSNTSTKYRIVLVRDTGRHYMEVE